LKQQSVLGFGLQDSSPGTGSFWSLTHKSVLIAGISVLSSTLLHSALDECE